VAENCGAGGCGGGGGGDGGGELFTNINYHKLVNKELNRTNSFYFCDINGVQINSIYITNKKFQLYGAIKIKTGKFFNSLYDHYKEDNKVIDSLKIQLQSYNVDMDILFNKNNVIFNKNTPTHIIFPLPNLPIYDQTMDYSLVLSVLLPSNISNSKKYILYRKKISIDAKIKPIIMPKYNIVTIIFLIILFIIIIILLFINKFAQI
jgi:hypothetical protein